VGQDHIWVSERSAKNYVMHAHPDHTTGHCVVTLGTGTRSDVVWEGIEVLASHSYAVIGSSVFSFYCM
jgi:hypothetical protein